MTREGDDDHRRCLTRDGVRAARRTFGVSGVSMPRKQQPQQHEQQQQPQLAVEERAEASAAVRDAEGANGALLRLLDDMEAAGARCGDELDGERWLADAEIGRERHGDGGGAASDEDEAEGWAELPPELLTKVLGMLEPAEQSYPEDEGGWSSSGWCGSVDSAAVRLVCSQWKVHHDAVVTRLGVRWQTTDEAVGMLAWRFPTVTSLELQTSYPYGFRKTLNDAPFPPPSITDAGMPAVRGFPSLTCLQLLRCDLVSDYGLRVVSSLPALSRLELISCNAVTAEGLSATSLPALTELRLVLCKSVTDDGLRAVSTVQTLTSLDLSCCSKTLTARGLLAVSHLRSLTFLDLTWCLKLHDEAVMRSLTRGLTALTSLKLSCTSVKDAGVRLIASDLTALTHLELYNSSSLTDRGVVALSRLPALTQLELQDCFEVTAAGVQALRRKVGPRLFVEADF
jgi:hypothetical protein